MSGGPILLTGASGLLGTWLRRTCPVEYAIVSVVHRHPLEGLPAVRADLRDVSAVRAAITEVQPSLILHAAYSKDRASIVDATRNVADAAAEVGAEVVLVSTDAVFSGDGTVRDEHATPDPIWDYGQWKTEAEQVLSAHRVASAIVRLPLVVSVDPDDHVVELIRSAATQGETTTWYSDEVRQPALASELAEAIWQIVMLEPLTRSGVWHLPGPESLNRYQIACRVVAAIGVNPEVVRAESTPDGAQRPRRLHLLSKRAADLIGWSPTAVLI